MSLYLLVAVLHMFIAFGKGALPHSTCERRFEKIGCFVDNTGQQGALRTLPVLLVNDRDPTSDAYDGHRLDWHKWPESIHSLACRCENVTRARGWKVFGLQFYGECWSGQTGETTFNKYGVANPKKCIQELVDPFPPCDKSKDMECVGAQSTNYVYRLKELTPADVNGGFSSWSQWTECSKDCGGGTRVRERTCTNPPPSGNGIGCAGDAEESEKCNEFQCPDPCKRSLDVGLIIDGSASVGAANFKKALDFLVDLVGHLAVSPQGTHVAVIVYDTQATLHFNLASSGYHTLSKLQSAIRGLSYLGKDTRTDVALEMAAEKIFSSSGGDRNDVDNLLIVLTGGKTHAASKPYEDVVLPLQKKGVRTVAVGVSGKIDDKELLKIAAGNAKYFTHLNDFDDLKKNLAKIVQDSCQGAGDVDGAWSSWSSWTQCSKTCGGGVKARRRSCTNPPPNRNGQSCAGQIGETAACSENPCPIPCTKALDIGIILDGSGSVGSSNFRKAKAFVEELIEHFAVSPQATHFGAITYSTYSKLEFDFADARYHKIVELKRRVMAIRYPGGWTRTDRALEMAAQKLFTVAGGDRKDKRNVLVVFTDGKTNRGSKSYMEVLRPLQARGVRTVAVGIGRGINRRELLQIAMSDSQYVIQVQDFNSLKQKLQMILDDSCQGSPPPKPNPDCHEGALGLENKVIPDNAITVTSQWDGNHGPDRARLNTVKSGVKRGAWSARYNDVGQFIQVDVGKIVKITKILTQGRNDLNQWVKSFWLSYSLNDGYYQIYGEQSPVIFAGNTDRNTIKVNVLDDPIYTRFIRLHPKTYHGHMSLRLELYGCKTGFVPPSPPLCLNALGMQNGKIKPGDIQASSQYDQRHRPDNGRLHFQRTSSRTGAWSARINDKNQWFQVKFERAAKIRRVACQGRMDADQWVTKYTLEYSLDGKSWKDYGFNGKTTEFRGSSDRFSVVTETINPPIVAHYVRVRPKTWHRHISMRLEFYGCTEDGDICNVQKPCKNGAQCTNIVGGYHCKCSGGFKGKNCDEDIDECKSKPCKNGAQCTNTPGDYTCKCVGGWFTGKNCDQVPQECIMNVKLSERNRASGTLRRSFLQCDRRNLPTIGQWHQFVGDAGTKMPNSCVPTQRCGTHAPGWMQGKHPKKEEGAVYRKVCFHWSGNCCRWSVQIKVRNCNGYYVYKLERPPTCYLRFCGDKGHDICEPKNPCKNGGICKPQGDSYYCQCKPGYQGRNCDKDVNECVPRNPCKNGGVCANTMGSYKCTCVGGWFTGKHCDQAPVECSKYTVLNTADRASGSVLRGSAKCDRSLSSLNSWHRFEGQAGTRMPTSAVAVNRCGTHASGWLSQPHPRKEDGVVVRKVCFNWSGNRCRWSVNIRVRNCGAFYVYYLVTTRVCSLRYCGNKNHDVCNALNPCKNGATCRPNGDGSSCQCTANFQGQFCDKDVNECAVRNPCKNGAKCTNTHGSYKCTCVGGWFTGKHCDQAPVECSSYSTLNTADRAAKSTGNINKCDRNDLASIPKWYRFSGAAGTMMPTSSVPVRYCGTHAPGWMNGKHPSKNEGAVSRKVCFHWSNNVCLWNIQITVRNCGSFYVYKLPRTPHCSLRYCGTNAQTPVPAECSSYTTLNTADRAAKSTGNMNKCDRNDLSSIPKWYRFSGAAGTMMPTSSVPVRHCGTHAPGWMNGKHPSKNEGAVSRKVCFHWSNNVCLWNIQITVRNCGSFYVYKLPRTPHCSLRYCGTNAQTPVPAECSSYTTLNTADRAAKSPGNMNKCDRNDLSSIPKWYRFSGAAGTMMPTSSVPVRYCGTHAPGWMNGKHPSKNEGAVSRKVCFHWNNNVCLWNIQITVRNCGSFYVYKLPRTPYCSLRYCGTNVQTPVPAECSSYTTLNTADRAAKSPGNMNKCDRNDLSSIPKWYRFSGAAGTMMPTSSVPVRYCGTHAPGWMNGKHPSKNEGAVSRKVCFHWNNNVCLWNIQITVRNCGSFYVYKLPRTPYCSLRYCGTNVQTPVPAECSSYTTLNTADRAAKSPGNMNKCDRNDLSSIPKWYRFSGAAGTMMPTSSVPVRYCGTHAPGWMNGKHPSKNEGAVSRKVCFHWNNNVCLWNIQITVRNCGSFYVYKLPRTPYCSLRYCGTNVQTPVPAECSSYTTLNTADRAAKSPGNMNKCDRNDLSSIPKWYRFSGAAGTMMPTSSVPVRYCGTHAPGWMNGKHPSKNEGAVSRKVCFHWNNNVCLWNIQITVRNCGSFYVYKLPRTPYCSLRYCGTNVQTPVPAECSSYTTLNTADC
ncbi:uncharacterized protein [Acropora muricata]|uniref:uncharacterized protein isoform X2 n=1 Tax=Acropora muricata TaxID=159855 RepID=UPI0034E486AA